MTLVDVITGRPHRIALSFAPVDLDETQLPTGIWSLLVTRAARLPMPALGPSASNASGVG